jgi:membrane-bound metal-dependent hydrolase YbcI (DUF457 family)
LASPIGHALVGIGLAALAVPATGVAPSPALWMGAVVASGLPDLDFVGTLFGVSVRRAHRGGTHSLLVLGVVALVALGVSWQFVDIIPPNLIAAWSVVLLSHPLVDLLATGPRAGRMGLGLPLFWPLCPRRWYLRRPPIRPPSLEQYRSGAAWCLLLPELALFGPACVGMVLLGGVL